MILITGIQGNWFSGKYATASKVYKFHAKLFDTPSNFGINGGRVSKLSVDDGSRYVFNYDRGIDVDSPIGYEIEKALCEVVKS